MDPELRQRVIDACNLLTEVCYGASKAGGWHSDRHTGEPHTPEQTDALFPTRIALIHSEVSEALEGHRTDAMDDKLPHRQQAEVEIGDTIIRAFDLGGCMRYSLGEAIVEKMELNGVRADHQHENRRKAGGKKY